jgi:membrane protease YdiL (CAAX protease family)
VALLETAAAYLGTRMQLSRLWLIAGTRTAQMLVVMTLAVVQGGGLQALGLDKRTLLGGFKRGLVWSAGFAVAAGLLFMGLIAAGQDPFTLVRSPLPQGAHQQMLFFTVGGIVAPVAEEIVFRGLIFGYLRRWGIPAAVVISTTLFAALHLPAVPITQVVGGLVFAVAYHTGGSLMAPIVIHVLGNLAIFTLSLPGLR